MKFEPIGGWESITEKSPAVYRYAKEQELRVTRLRKAVNWLRGANHDNMGIDELPENTHHGTVDDCTVWECQRARDILEETKDE